MKNALLPTFLTVLLVGTLANGQSNDEPTIVNGKAVVSGFGTHVFRAILDEKGISPRDSDDIHRDLTRAIIVLLGPNSMNMVEWALQAVEKGATLLIASDQFAALSGLGVEITGDTVTAAKNDCYLGLPLYPFVRPLEGEKMFESFSNRGPDAVATMRTSTLQRFDDPRRNFSPVPLAGFPKTAQLDFGEYDERLQVFAASGRYGEGRVLILADHSVLIDTMLVRPDIANMRFARNVVAWLQGPENRNTCFFFEDGNWKNKFALPTVPFNEDWLDLFLKGLLVFEKHGDKIISQNDNADTMNKAILSRFPLREIRRALLIGLTVLCIAFAFRWLTKARSTPDPARILVTPDLAALIPHGPQLRQRFEAQAESGNVYQSARDLVRDMMGGLGAEPGSDGTPPRITVAAGEPHPEQLRRRVFRLWEIGFGSHPLPIAPGEMQKLTTELSEVLVAADNGWWKFDSVQHAEPAPVRAT